MATPLVSFAYIEAYVLHVEEDFKAIQQPMEPTQVISRKLSDPKWKDPN